MFRFSPRRNRAEQVNWREWGEAAFREAQQQDKPVVVFITAFWCGFCQRMDETTLSNNDVIAVLNALFVPVRVEESQRPDVDIRYNQNGWPTIVFLTPDGTHLMSVNYLAPIPFMDVLARVADFYEQNRAALRAAAAQTNGGTPRRAAEGEAPLSMAIVGEIAGIIEGMADRAYGGYGDALKFFHNEANEFFLYLFETTGERAFLDHVLFTLDRMRESKTYDERDGGFYRYSSKRDWQEPHPEKILDDQAGLLALSLHAWLLAERPTDRQTAERLVDYLNTTLFDRDRGVFCGCQDYVRMPGSATGDGVPGMLSLIDPYVYCDANARTASGYLLAWWLLGREDCRARAVGVLEWLWEHLRAPNGGMYHYYAEGAPHVRGLLRDAVLLGLACLDAYAFLGDATYLGRARQVADYLLRTHRNPDGGFFDIEETGPAALRFPLTMLTENATVAQFFLRLADLSGDARYREQARWALQRFPNTHRQHGAFAGGFGHALARLLAAPLSAVVNGGPGDPMARRLLRAVSTQLGYPNVVVQTRVSEGGPEATITLRLGDRAVGPIADPMAVQPEILAGLNAT